VVPRPGPAAEDLQPRVVADIPHAEHDRGPGQALQAGSTDEQSNGSDHHERRHLAADLDQDVVPDGEFRAQRKDLSDPAIERSLQVDDDRRLEIGHRYGEGDDGNSRRPE